MNIVKRILSIALLYIKNRGRKVRISYHSDVSSSCTFEGMCQIHKGAFFRGHLGYGSYIGENSKIRANVGKYCSIGNDVRVVIGRHPFEEPYVSTSPCFYSKNTTRTQCGESYATDQLFEEYKYVDGYHVKIGNDCWIGERAILIGGITVGDGAVVLASACVTKDVPPYAIVGGVPAKILRYRYDEETISFLEHVKWWDKSPDWIRENYLLFSDMCEFKKQMQLCQ